MKSAFAPVLLLVVLLGIAGQPLVAQNVISAQAGLVNFTEGPVLLNGREAQPARGVFPQMKEQDQLRTTRGRAELLLSPGVFLRLGRESSVRLVSGDITDSRVELMTGSVVLEAGEIPKKTAVTLMVGDASVSILKRGLYRIGADPAELRVFDGKARVVSDGKPIELGKGRSLSLTGNSVVAKFDRKDSDTLDQWSNRRAQYLSLVNMSTARSLLSQNSRLRCNGWCFNTYYGLITFVPMSGYYVSPYGYYFYSAPALYESYTRPAYAGGGGSSAGMGSSGTARSAPTASVQIPAGMGSTRSDPAPVARPSGTGR